MIHDTVTAVHCIAEPFYSNWSTWGYMHTHTRIHTSIHLRPHTIIYHTVSIDTDALIHLAPLGSASLLPLPSSSKPIHTHTQSIQAGENKEWCWDNFVNFRSMQSAESVREQLARIMRKLNLPLVRLTHDHDCIPLGPVTLHQMYLLHGGQVL